MKLEGFLSESPQIPQEEEAHRMREQYPEHAVDDDIQMILDIIALCNG